MIPSGKAHQLHAVAPPLPHYLCKLQLTIHQLSLSNQSQWPSLKKTEVSTLVPIHLCH